MNGRIRSRPCVANRSHRDFCLAGIDFKRERAIGCEARRDLRYQFTIQAKSVTIAADERNCWLRTEVLGSRLCVGQIGQVREHEINGMTEPAQQIANDKLHTS